VYFKNERQEGHSFMLFGKQKVISDMKSLLKDPDIARLFENTFPNTLGKLFASIHSKVADFITNHVDTTVKYFSEVSHLHHGIS